ncbi:glycosyltransferase family 61 protein [Arcticibacter tournemirensis]|nr:glycosyltransferase family 61 protein [Arcticibacter tournemirensis]
MEIQRRKPENYVEGELDFCKREFSYPTYDVQILTLKNRLVSFQGFVYDDYFKVNKKSLLNPEHYRGFFNAKHFIKKVWLRGKREANRDEKYLLAFDEWTDAHYHWFTDFLSRVYAAKEIIKDHILLLPDHSAYIKETGIRSLQLLGLKPKGIEFIKFRELLKVQQLTLVTHACMPGYINDPLMKQIRDELRKNLDLDSIVPKRKLYISRDKAGYRKILNEQDVWDVLKSFGYEIVRFEDMDLFHQIRLSASCKSLVSIHGAGLTNMLFMKPGSSVLEFRRDRIYHNQYYWHLADSLDLKYHYLFGKPDMEDQYIEGEGCNITIDIHKLKGVLQKMEDGSPIS